MSPQAPLLDALLLALVEVDVLLDEDDALVDDEALVDEELLDAEDELLDEALLAPLPSITTCAPQPTIDAIQARPTRIAFRISGC